MLTKEQFRHYINFIQQRQEAQDKINELFSDEFTDCIFWPYERYEIAMVNLLKDVMYDECDWIGYFIYELDFGATWRPGTVTEGDIDIPLGTVDDLYDLLIRE